MAVAVAGEGAVNTKILMKAAASAANEWGEVNKPAAGNERLVIVCVRVLLTCICVQRLY